MTEEVMSYERYKEIYNEHGGDMASICLFTNLSPEEINSLGGLPNES